VVVVRAEASAPDGLRRVVEAYIGRRPREPEGEDMAPGTPAVQVLAWREVR
jgi:hypothetical protein